MNFDESEIISAAMIGFDMIEGPVLKWTHTFVENQIDIDFEEFMMNFYLSFRGGNDGLKPHAILYDNFYIVAFPRGLELCCLFMKPRGVNSKINRLGKVADKIMDRMDEIEEAKAEEPEGNGNEDVDEVKRIIVNMLSDQEMSTPEIRRYFKMTNSEVWRVMSQLEEDQRIMRTEKVGRAQMWTRA